MTYCILIAALIIRPHRASFLFVFVTTMFNVLFGDTGGHYYFPLAAFCDFIVTGLLFHFRIDRKVYEVMVMSVVSLMLNLLGWLMWYTYQPPDLYVTLFGIFYAAAVVLILRKDDTNAGGIGLHIDYAFHHPDVNAGSRLVKKG